MKKFLPVLAALMMLSACAHGSAEIEGDGYRIRGDNYGYGHPGHGRGFCPPGHAKKGWC
jgi:hypothetical protein